MKIGILTFQWAINYGAVLQMYALKSFLSNKTDDVEIINYEPVELTNAYSLKILQNGITFKTRIRRVLNNLFQYEQHRKFSLFLKKYFHLSDSITDNKAFELFIKKYNLVIVGSDQVWNEKIIKEHLEAYLLKNFSGNKITYSASLGANEISINSKKCFKKALMDFDFISIRESESIEYLKNIAPREDYIFTIDPVFLLNKEEWLELISGRVIDCDYILIYMLETNLELLNSARVLSLQKNLKIYSIEPNGIRILKGAQGINMLYSIGPLDFVNLFYNAKYIFTNSFHGTAFSLIFEKIFYCYPHSTRNLRIKNLLELYNLSDQQINKAFTIEELELIAKKCKETYNSKDNPINSLILQSKEYLDKAVKHFDK